MADYGSVGEARVADGAGHRGRAKVEDLPEAPECSTTANLFKIAGERGLP